MPHVYLNEDCRREVRPTGCEASAVGELSGETPLGTVNFSHVTLARTTGFTSNVSAIFHETPEFARCAEGQAAVTFRQPITVLEETQITLLRLHLGDTVTYIEARDIEDDGFEQARAELIVDAPGWNLVGFFEGVGCEELTERTI